MSLAKNAVEQITFAREYFNRSTDNLTEVLSGFSPAEGMMTVSQQVAHAARVIDWLIEGAFRPEGFDLDFDPQIQQVLAVDSLGAARFWFDQSLANAAKVIEAQTDDDLMTALPQGPVMGGQPRLTIVSALVDHTAHHRGVLTVYARLNGIIPSDPFGM